MSEPTEPRATEGESAEACQKCSHSAALHNPMGICWQPVIRSQRDRKARFCGCLTDEAVERFAALRAERESSDV